MKFGNINNKNTSSERITDSTRLTVQPFTSSIRRFTSHVLIHLQVEGAMFDVQTPVTVKLSDWT